MSVHAEVEGYPSCRCGSGSRAGLPSPGKSLQARVEVSWTSPVDPVLKPPGWQALSNTAAPVPPEFLRSYNQRKAKSRTWQHSPNGEKKRRAPCLDFSLQPSGSVRLKISPFLNRLFPLQLSAALQKTLVFFKKILQGLF